VNYHEVNPDMAVISGTGIKTKKIQNIVENNSFCRAALDDENFCSFCILEQHIQSCMR